MARRGAGAVSGARSVAGCIRTVGGEADVGRVAFVGTSLAPFADRRAWRQLAFAQSAKRVAR